MMSTGTRKVRIPRNFHFGLMAPYALMEFLPVFRPTAISDVKRVKPNVKVRIR